MLGSDVASIRPELKTEVTFDGTTYHRLRAEAIEDLLVAFHYTIKV